MARINKQYIEQLAQNVRNALARVGQPSVGILDVDHSVRLLGGTILVSDVGLTGLAEAKIVKSGEHGFQIQLRSGIHPNRRKFTTAHELGHLFLHMGYLVEPEVWKRQAEFLDAYERSAGPAYDIKEMEANHFAGAFLMPEHEFIEVKNRNLSADRRSVLIDPIANHFGVSSDAVITRGRVLKQFGWGKK